MTGHFVPGDLVREKGSGREMTVATYPFARCLGGGAAVACLWAEGTRIRTANVRVERLEKVIADSPSHAPPGESQPDAQMVLDFLRWLTDGGSRRFAYTFSSAGDGVTSRLLLGGACVTVERMRASASEWLQLTGRPGAVTVEELSSAAFRRVANDDSYLDPRR